MSMEPTPDRSLDTRGLYCPEPIYRTRIEINSLNIGQVLEVWADDPAAEEDIKVWARRTGQEILHLVKKGQELRFLIRKIK